MDIVGDVLDALASRKKQSADLPRKQLPLPKSCPAVFIDGSNGDILDNLTFIRAVAVFYDETLVCKQKNEFFCILEPLQTFPAQGFTCEDAGKMRRCAELALALKVAQSSTGKLIVLDGSLDPDEKDSLLRLEEACQANNHTLIGLSKTCSWLHEGSSIQSVAQRGPQGYVPWRGSFFVKLHPQASHSFRVDIKGDVEKALSALAYYAKDPSFFGYPYPLVYADAQAKITQKELHRIRTVFAKKAGKTLKEQLDPHTIIDQINMAKK
jgi:hypothetical protein